MTLFLFMQFTFVKSSQTVSECPSDKLPEYAFIGRSNVGKSSLINAIAGHSKLAKVSGTPGKTRVINHFLVDDLWYLVDLPGYGWAKVSKTEKSKWEDNISEYLLKRPNLDCLFVLVDIRHDPQNNDLTMFEWLAENNIAFAIVFTKSDKLSKNKIQSHYARYRKILKLTWAELPPMTITSSVSKEGIEELIRYIHEIHT